MNSSRRSISPLWMRLSRPRTPSMPFFFHRPIFPAIPVTRIVRYNSQHTHKLVEEETLEGYKPHYYYPVYLGQIFKSQYQVITKLGFGTGSTVWLCRDLKNKTFVTLKVCTAPRRFSVNNELPVCQHMKSIDWDNHTGQHFVRLTLDDFQIEGPHGKHQCLVHKPLGVNLTNARKGFPGSTIPKDVLQYYLALINTGLNLIHQLGVVHTDLSPNNILIGVNDHTVFSQLEQEEKDDPSPRISRSDRDTFISRQVPLTFGPAVICDFGAARIGQIHTGDVMPTPYRAPEIIMGMEWDCKIDIWALGVMTWHLFEGRLLFKGVKGNAIDDEQHLAEMVSIMGPPPKEFVQRSDKCRQYWDSEGNWIAATPIPDQSLETREAKLEGADKELLLKLMRKILRWLPEDRPGTQELFFDDFITQWFDDEMRADNKKDKDAYYAAQAATGQNGHVQD